MKTLPFIPSLGSVAIASVCLLAVSPALNAGDRTGNLINEVSQFINKTANGVSQNQPIRAVKSLPGYIIALGNGYAGRGYYYGPPNTTYYERHRDVRYYSTREEIPREYYRAGQGDPQGYYPEVSTRRNSVEASVQQALARNGYYNGPVDGSIGPMSRRSIAAYQQDHGLAVTGNINSGLLSSLGL